MSVLARAMTEAELQSAIIAAAKLLGWRVCHFRAAKTERGWRTPIEGDAGFPDLVLARRMRVLFLECKSDKGRLSPDQSAWCSALPDYWLVRPSDLDAVLAALQ